MNLVATLAKEHSRAQCDRIVRYVGDNPVKFAELVSVFLAGPYRITQRAAWPLGYCAETHPNLIRPHLKKIVRNLKNPDLHDAVRRNTVLLLQFVEIPRSLQGEVASHCYAMFRDPKAPIAIRVFSMTVLTRIAQVQPELKSELKIMIEDQLLYASSGFLSRARKVLKQLQ